MINPSSNSAQVLEQFRHKLTEETNAIAQKEKDITSAESEKRAADEALRKVNEELIRLKAELPKLQAKINEADSKKKKLLGEREILKKQQAQTNMEFTRTQNAFKDTMKKSNTTGQAKYGRSVL